MRTDDRYIKQYREKLRELNRVEEGVNSLRREIDSLSQEMAQRRITHGSLLSEITAMRKVISVMIDEDVDHVEAKLKVEPSDMINTIWTDSESPYPSGDIMLSAGQYPISRGASGVISTINVDKIDSVYHTVSLGPFGNP